MHDKQITIRKAFSAIVTQDIFYTAILSHKENVTADNIVQVETAATAKSVSPLISFAIT